MKKLLVLAVTLAITLMANAQVSVQLGGMSNIVRAGNNEGGKVSGAYRGVMAAVDYNLHMTDNFGIAPGLGVDYAFSNPAGFRYQEVGLFAPIDFNYGFQMNDNLRLSLFAGPTLYYGLLSQETSVFPPYNYYVSDSKRFDVSLGGGLWLDIVETVRLKFGYKYGLTNTSKIAGITEKNQFLTISAGYIF